MKLSLNWLNDFVDLRGISARDIMDKLSMATAEVEGFELRGESLTNIVVGEIKTCQPHPTSKKPLSLLTVDNGREILKVVCAAPNCRAGLKVVYAQVGSTVGDIKVGRASLAGEESNGMCLSERELGISNFHDTIIELNTTAANGTPIAQVLPDIADVVFEVDNKSLTNRPDLWGHYGFARELAVIFDRKLKPLPVADLDKYNDLPAVSVTIENKEDCYSFGAFKAENITQKITPQQIKTRLWYCDVGDNGFLVDLSNYVMLELGQPNHTFDARKIGKLSAGNIVGDERNVTKYGNRPTFTTLKEQSFDIKPEHLFIKSDGKPVSLAGIMGGANSLICADTTAVVWEWATFNPYAIRRTSTDLGIRSDSSTRYEKSLDTNLNKLGASRAIHLLTQFDKGAKVVSNFNWKVAQPTKGKTIKLKKKFLENYVGMKFDYKDVQRHLEGLGFDPMITATEIIVTTPSWRATKDVSLPVDIVEEIARTFGYDNIPPLAPKVEIKPIDPIPHLKHAKRVRKILCYKYAMNEVHTYIWNDEKVMKALKIQTPSYLQVVNSVAAGCDNIRSNLMPSLLGVVAKNKNNESIRVFEIGEVFTKYPDDPELKSRDHLAIAIAHKQKSAEELYRELAHILTDVFDLLGVELRYDLGKCDMKILPYLHPKNNAVIKIGEQVIGKIGIVHPTVASTIDSKMGIVVGAMCMDTLNELLTSGRATLAPTQRPSKYPTTTLDFTITTKATYGELATVFNKFTDPLSFGCKLKDIYERESGDISYTLTFTVGSREKTLTADEIQSVWAKVVAHGKKNGFTIDNTQ